MAQLIILAHEYDVRRTFGHLIGPVARRWVAAGHRVRVAAVPAQPWPADLALLHVDLSVIPPRYLDAARGYRVAFNRTVGDIRKRTISRNLVSPGDGYAGPVIVKTDLNSNGMPEFLKNQIAHRKGLVAEAPAPVGRATYPVYGSPAQVPQEIWDDPALVVERFLPEIDGDGSYAVRACYYLGAVEADFRLKAKGAIVKGTESFAAEPVATPPALSALRKAMGLDFGKIDYVVHGGEVNVLDVSLTPAYGTLKKYGFADEVVHRLAAGVDAFL